MSSTHVLQSFIGTGLAVMSLVYWWYVPLRLERRFRRWCERRFGVEIAIGAGGTWSVDGRGSALRRFAISWLQLGFFLGATFVWALGAVLGAGALYLLR